MIRWISFLACTLLLTGTVVAQNQFKLDSLQSRLKSAETDSIEIQVLLDLSIYYRNLDYPKSVNYAKEAVALAHEKDEIKLEQKAERQLFTIFFTISDFKSASTHAFNALRLCEVSGDSAGTVAMMSNLGVIHDRLEEFDKALEYYLKALNRLTSLSMDDKTKTSYLTTLYNNIANVYQTKSDFQSAREYYEKSLSMARQVNNKQTEAIALNNLGKLYMTDLKQPDQAYKYLKEGLDLRIALGDKNGIPTSYINLANYYRREKKFPEARQSADQALLLGKEIGSLFILRDAYQAVLLIEKARGNYEESLEASLKFKELNDSIQKQLAGSELSKLQLQYDFEKAEQANQLEQSQIRTRFTIAVIILAAAFLVAVLIVITVRSRAKQTELKQKNLAQDVEIKNKELTTNIIYLVRKNELINDVAERLLQIKQTIPVDNQKAIQNIVIELQHESDNDTWKEFEVRFNQVHSDFYEKLRKQYPDLSPADEKLCAFLRLNMSTKEIAAITKQNVKSLEVARARLRKKLNLTNTSSSLVVHLAKI